MAAKEAGLEKLVSVSASGERTLPLTASPGQETITQQLQKDKEEIDALAVTLLDSRDRLKECATQWEMYEESQGEMEEWLKDMEERLGTGLELQPGLDTKQDQVEKLKVRSNVIVTRVKSN